MKPMLFAYLSHPEDFEKLFAYAQALDRQRGRLPGIRFSVSPQLQTAIIEEDKKNRAAIDEHNVRVSERSPK